MRYRFKCKHCGGNRLEEVMKDVVVASSINGVIHVDEDCVSMDYGEQSNEDGEISHYSCMDCGETIAESQDELSEYLKEHGTQKYSVCLIPRVKVRIDDIEADSQEDALKKAVEHFKSHAASLLNNDIRGVPQVRYTEASEDESDFIGLVDEDGDEEFEESGWYFFLESICDVGDEVCAPMKGHAWQRLQKAMHEFAEEELKKRQNEKWIRTGEGEPNED